MEIKKRLGYQRSPAYLSTPANINILKNAQLFVLLGIFRILTHLLPFLMLMHD